MSFLRRKGEDRKENTFAHFTIFWQIFKRKSGYGWCTNQLLMSNIIVVLNHKQTNNWPKRWWAAAILADSFWFFIFFTKKMKIHRATLHFSNDCLLLYFCVSVWSLTYEMSTHVSTWLLLFSRCCSKLMDTDILYFFSFFFWTHIRVIHNSFRAWPRLLGSSHMHTNTHSHLRLEEECVHLFVNWAVGKCVMACRMIVVDKCLSTH